VATKKILEVKNLSVSFADFCVFHGVGFTVDRGEALAIIGPNGSGKSVLLRALLGLLPYGGKVRWAPRIRIGYVPQKISIEASLPVTVFDFMRFKARSSVQIIAALEAVGINGDHHYLERNILKQPLGTLSGGQLQRIMIAWAIIDDPDILLFDEPTSGIDVGGEKTIYDLLHRLQTKKKMAVILISHDLNIVYRNADRVLCLNGKAICYGAPHTVLDADSLRQLYGGETKFFQPHAHN